MMWRATHRRAFAVMRRHYPEEIPLELLRQKAVLIENLSPKLLDTQNHVIDTFSKCGIKITQDDVHIMRNRFGIPCGRVMVLVKSVMMPNFDFNDQEDTQTNDHTSKQGQTADSQTSSQYNESTTVSFITKGVQKTLLDSLPPDARAYICDEHDVKCYVEQCERYLTLSEDLRRFAEPTNIHRIVTISGMNKTYGRLEMAEVIDKHTSVKVHPCNIMFRFKSNGEQDSTAWVLCDSIKDANRIIANLQEVAIPKRYQYGSLMGASFVYAARSSLFLSNPELDFITKKSKYHVFTIGWHPDVDEQELTHLANSLKFFPKSVKVIHIPASDGTKHEVGAFFECDRMRNAKKLMVRLHMLKRRWKIPEHSTLYAYPKTADVRWESDNGVYKEDDPADFSDLDEPVHY
ncbi:uncharacterized protein BXIN_1357 [Babesia sp. Xinjiang]|uniref:uncharacterized protein n=1 Tax=Babesia sp. Xinjiang TaxID=462227 RepID=UPI000A21B77C|nr:uncharacterized protein BXIN_1357 [Babesia sp. Xinjiang]ORM39914.1 hypothetical protein BXIN_1357 [Babesia sp. Xinjiang]